MKFDTRANALLYKAAGFTDAQVEALVEGDRLVVAVRKTSGRPYSSRLADHWRLWFALATIGTAGLCDTILVLALKHWGGY